VPQPLPGLCVRVYCCNLSSIERSVRSIYKHAEQHTKCCFMVQRGSEKCYYGRKHVYARLDDFAVLCLIDWSIAVVIDRSSSNRMEHTARTSVAVQHCTVKLHHANYSQSATNSSMCVRARTLYYYTVKLHHSNYSERNKQQYARTCCPPQCPPSCSA
jgi:hypothetical protein